MKAEEEQADTLIREFDAWFQKMPNDPIIPSERAILKTFLYFLATQQNTTAVPVIRKDKEHGEATGSRGSVL